MRASDPLLDLISLAVEMARAGRRVVIQAPDIKTRHECRRRVRVWYPGLKHLIRTSSVHGEALMQHQRSEARRVRGPKPGLRPPRAPKYGSGAGRFRDLSRLSQAGPRAELLRALLLGPAPVDHHDLDLTELLHQEGLVQFDDRPGQEILMSLTEAGRQEERQTFAGPVLVPDDVAPVNSERAHKPDSDPGGVPHA